MARNRGKMKGKARRRPERRKASSQGGLHRLLQSTGREAEQSARMVLSLKDRAERVVQLADNSRGTALRVIRQSPSAGRHECEAGCAYCCHTAVTVAPPEIFAIARYLKAHHSEQQLLELLAKLDENAEKASSMSREEYIAHLVPCGLMTDDGNCLAHPVRPLACAGFLSTSRRRCEAEFHREPSREPVPVDKFASAAAMCVAIGLRDACKNAGLEHESFELHHALRRVLVSPDAEQRWARGEEVFAGCLT